MLPPCRLSGWPPGRAHGGIDMSGYTLVARPTQAGGVAVVQTPSGALVTTTWAGGTAPIAIPKTA
jgi:hypothetical protein